MGYRDDDNAFPGVSNEELLRRRNNLDSGYCNPQKIKFAEEDEADINKELRRRGVLEAKPYYSHTESPNSSTSPHSSEKEPSKLEKMLRPWNDLDLASIQHHQDSYQQRACTIIPLKQQPQIEHVKAILNTKEFQDKYSSHTVLHKEQQAEIKNILHHLTAIAPYYFSPNMLSCSNHATISTLLKSDREKHPDDAFGHFKFQFLYELPLPQGHIELRGQLIPNLGRRIENSGNDFSHYSQHDKFNLHLLHTSEQETAAKFFKNVPAIVISGVYRTNTVEIYYFGKPLRGLHLGSNHGMGPTYTNQLYESLLNILCEQKSFTTKNLLTTPFHNDPQERHTLPLSYSGHSGTESTTFAYLNNPTLKRCQQADQPLSEFMHALRSQKKELKQIYTLTCELFHQYQTSANFRGSELPYAQELVKFSEQQASRYFTQLKKIVSRISVPQNNRMDYLATDISFLDTLNQTKI